MQEVELKLEIAPEAIGRLRRNPLVRSLVTERGRTRRLRTVYFDTPELLLSKQGMALRIRHDGQHRIQTLKQPMLGPAGLQSNREMECEVAADVPDLARIEDAPLQAFFAAHGVAGSLAPIFETRIERRTWPLHMFDSTIELALDVGEIRSGERTQPICEAELELRSGRRGRLFELALALHESMPVRLGNHTKAARGYRLFTAATAEPVRAAPVRLDPAMTAGEAFAEIARSCLDQLRGNEACTRRGEDPEGIHQMRVAVRRFRSLAGAYRPLFDETVHARLGEELRWLQQQLGPARDWDVFVDQTLAPMAERLPHEMALELLRREAAGLRDAARKVALAALDDPRYTALLLHVGLWLEAGSWARPGSDGAPPPAAQPVVPFAAALLQKHHRRMRKQGGRHAELSEPELHRLRIIGKKLRYNGEFFRDLFPKRGRRSYLDQLNLIQETLGSLNDAAVGRGLIRQLEERLAERAPALAGRAVGLLLGWQAARVDADLGRIGGVWDAFVELGPFWRDSAA
ncbi:MAG: CHAD domain-containing protein [Dongiaceae bacterium]